MICVVPALFAEFVWEGMQCDQTTHDELATFGTRAVLVEREEHGHFGRGVWMMIP